MAEKKCYKLKWRQKFIEKKNFAKELLNLDKENGKKIQERALHEKWVIQ